MVATATRTPKATKNRKVKRLRGPHCPRCEHEYDLALLRDGRHTCVTCRRTHLTLVGHPPPPVVRRPDAAAGDTTECIHHQDNLAVDACGRCGSFLCALCRMETDEQVLCPGCLDKLNADGKLASLRGQLVNYGYLALYWSLGGLIFPFALFFAIPAWVNARRNARQNRELGETVGSVQATFAIIFAVLTSLGCVGFWMAIVITASRR